MLCRTTIANSIWNIKRKSDNQQVTFSNPVVLHAIIIKKTITNNNQYIDIVPGGLGTHIKIFLNNFPRTTLEIFETGITVFRFYGINQRFDVDIAVSDF